MQRRSNVVCQLVFYLFVSIKTINAYFTLPEQIAIYDFFISNLEFWLDLKLLICQPNSNTEVA